MSTEAPAEGVAAPDGERRAPPPPPRGPLTAALLTRMIATQVAVAEGPAP